MRYPFLAECLAISSCWGKEHFSFFFEEYIFYFYSICVCIHVGGYMWLQVPLEARSIKGAGLTDSREEPTRDARNLTQPFYKSSVYLQPRSHLSALAITFLQQCSSWEVASAPLNCPTPIYMQTTTIKLSREKKDIKVIRVHLSKRGSEGAGREWENREGWV